MPARHQYRDREEVEVAVLDALVDRHAEGLTVFELRSRVTADIDEIERALANLKQADLVEVDEQGERVRILPADRVVPEPDEDEPAENWIDEIREKLPF